MKRWYGEFQPCSNACSNYSAGIFGDVNDKESQITKLKIERMYHLPEHTNKIPCDSQLKLGKY
jgi:molybdopterin-containing oxidoreductase family iron-sulfur binding subunit